ncbi:MAG: hypothetical protein WD688_03540 [Candidatus Binatia bacterium]
MWVSIKNRHWTFLLLVGLFLLCVGISRTTALDSKPLSIAELTTRSDVIALGTVISTTSDWDLNRTAIYTKIVLQVEQGFKGTGAGKEIMFQQLGGQAGDIVSEVAGTAVFKTGEKVVVFLFRNKKQSLEVVGSFQGKFLVEKRPPEGEMAVRRVPGIAKPLDEMSLGRLKMLIQTALAK